MFEFSHIVSVMLFIVIGGIGMASMQDGLGIVFKRLAKMITPAVQSKAGATPTISREDFFLYK